MSGHHHHRDHNRYDDHYYDDHYHNGGRGGHRDHRYDHHYHDRHHDHYDDHRRHRGGGGGYRGGYDRGDDRRDQQHRGGRGGGRGRGGGDDHSRGSQQPPGNAPSAGDFLKTRLVQSQEALERKQKEIDERRKLEKQIELEKQKQRILEQKRKIKQQQSQNKIKKARKKVDTSKLFSLDDDEEEENQAEKTSPKSGGDSNGDQKEQPQAQAEQATPETAATTPTPAAATPTATTPQQSSAASTTVTSTTTENVAQQPAPQEPKPKKSKWDQPATTAPPQDPAKIAQMLHVQQIAQKLLASANQKRDENGELIPPAPKDPNVMKAIDGLVEFVVKHGLQFENVVRSRNKGNANFKFLFDMLSPEYTYYKWKWRQKQKELEAEDTATMIKQARGDAPPPQVAEQFVAPPHGGGVPTYGRGPPHGGGPPHGVGPPHGGGSPHGGGLPRGGSGGMHGGPRGGMHGGPSHGGMPYGGAPFGGQHGGPHGGGGLHGGPPFGGPPQFGRQMQNNPYPPGGQQFQPPFQQQQQQQQRQQTQPLPQPQPQQGDTPRRKRKSSKWDVVDGPSDTPAAGGTGVASSASGTASSSQFDALDEQETSKSMNRPPPASGIFASRSSYNAAPPPQASYNAAPPPQSLSAIGKVVGGQRPLNRTNQFSVLNTDFPSEKAENAESSEKKKKRRRFTEKPTGDANSRTELDSVAQMNWYVTNADQSEQRDFVPPVEDDADAKPEKKRKSSGHHIGDFLPPDKAAEFEAQARGGQFSHDNKNKISSGNLGHRMLQKMGWKEGEGIGAHGNKGIAAPIGTHKQKWSHQGVGAGKEGDVTPTDDIYSTYKKRMMLAYRYRPNPLNNPRKPYY